jgi:hypothetical protein
MLFITAGLLIIIMAALARASGGGLGAHLLNKKGAVDEQGRDKGGIMPVNLTMLPEMIFGVFMAVPAALEFGLFGWLAGAAWVYGWMETGHGTAMHMGKMPKEAQSGRKQTLSVIIDPLCKAAGSPLGGVFYCWAFMGLKGALIGLTAPFWGFLLAVLWPVSYFVGNYLWFDEKTGYGRGEIAEFLSGGFAGLVLFLYFVA